MFLLNNKPLAVDTPFTHAGFQYPANWLRMASDADKKALGITEKPDPAPVDTRYYWSEGNPKDMDQLKEQAISQIKTTANSLLQATDWMIIRKIERNVEIPQAVQNARKAIQKWANDAEASVQAAKDIPALQAVPSYNPEVTPQKKPNAARN